MNFLLYFHSAISNHLSIAISLSPEWVVAYNRFNCIQLYKLAGRCKLLFNNDIGPQLGHITVKSGHESQLKRTGDLHDQIFL